MNEPETSRLVGRTESGREDTAGGPLSPSPSGDPASVPQLYQINIAPPPLLKVHLGDADSFGRYVASTPGALAAVWNENGVRVLLKNGSHVVTYRPEITHEAEQFFLRENEREKRSDGTLGPKVWAGDFEPVKFRRSDLRKFLSAHATDVPDDVIRGLSRLKLDQTEEESDAADGYTQVRQQKSSFPSKLRVNLEIMPGTLAELEFEVKTCSLEGRFGRETGHMGLELRRTNARQVLRRAMETALAQLPASIPRYYGSSPVPSEAGDGGRF